MYQPSQRGLHIDRRNVDGQESADTTWSEHRGSSFSRNGISMHAVRDTLRRFYMRDERNFRLHFDLRLFKERYASDLQSDGNPFRHSQVLSENDDEWVQHIQFDDGMEPVFLLCCPEDVQKCRACARQKGRLCNSCCIPLCKECNLCIGRGQTTEIPLALANDNFWGYTSDIIFRYKVRYLEMAIAMPYWTTMMVCYVEGDYGHLLNEEVGAQRYRTRVRGTALSFHMPWEEIVEELRLRCLDKNLLGKIPRKPECLKYMLRVHLRVDRQSMDKVLKQLTLRPYIILLLLNHLIDHNHEAFRGRGTAQQLRAQMRAAVERDYAVAAAEHGKPTEEQEYVMPPDFLESILDIKSGGGKRRKLMKEKNATPGEGDVSMKSCFEDRRPCSVVSETSALACSNPAALRTSTIDRFGTAADAAAPDASTPLGACIKDGDLSVQTGHELIPQWHGKYFAMILPFVIPYMVSGPDFEFGNITRRWRRGSLGDKDSERFLPAPWVSASKFVAGFARRVESQCRRDWNALPIMRTVVFKYMVPKFP